MWKVYSTVYQVVYLCTWKVMNIFIDHKNDLMLGSTRIIIFIILLIVFIAS